MAQDHKERLAKTVESMLLSSDISDMKIKCRDNELPAHRIVFKAFGSHWGQRVSEIELLDWTHLEQRIALATLTWLYTGKIPENLDEGALLSLMDAAGCFQLQDLVKLSEERLVSLTTVGNCFAMYAVAATAKASKLQARAAEIISVNWDTFTLEHFKDLEPELVCTLFIEIHADPLHKVIALGRIDVLEAFLKRHGSLVHQWINVKNKAGDLPLDIALSMRMWEIAHLLVGVKANINVRDKNDWNYLQRAISECDRESVKFLLDHEVDIFHVTPGDDDSCLHLLIKSVSKLSHTDEFPNGITKTLLEKGADPNKRNKKGLTPLHLALQTGCIQIVTDLLENHSIDVNLKSSDGYYPIKYGLENTQYWRELAELLIKAGAKVDVICTEDCLSLLQTIIESGLEEQALYLVEKLPKSHLDHTNVRGESALHYAALKGMAGVFAALLESGADPNIETVAPASRPVVRNGTSFGYMGYKLTCLHYAVLHGQTAVVDVLLDKRKSIGDKMDCNMKDSLGNTPLSLALNDQGLHLVPKLINAGADVNLRNSAGLTMLHKAILEQASDVALFLISNGADINARTLLEDKHPLHMAIENQLGDVVEGLCKKGVDMSVQNEKGECALWACLVSEQYDVASVLVRHGADTDAWGPGPEGQYETLLHAAINLNSKAATFLIESGCDVNSPQRSPPDEGGGELTGWTPLHLCCLWGLNSVAQSLLDHGANINKKDVEGKTPLHMAIENEQDELVKTFLNHPGVDVFERDQKGMSPFAVAVSNKYNKAASAILEKFPNAAEQFNKKGLNLLHVSLESNQVESVLFLLSINVDVNSITRDATRTPPLHIAAKGGNEVIVRSLILAGAKVNAVDAFTQTALHVAAAAGLPVVITALLSHDADPDLPDGDGNNALHIACKEGHLSAARVLLTESSVNAEAINRRGQNPLHTLARYGRENAYAICNLIAETMPDYPLDQPDVDGNTALLIAYMKGNGNLCRSLVRAGACLGSANLDGVTIFNYHVATKQLLYSLLESLDKEPKWSEGNNCLECGTNFTITMRKHHCRHCGRLLCSRCSDQDLAIMKYKLNKPVRVCAVCFLVLQGGAAP